MKVLLIIFHSFCSSFVSKKNDKSCDEYFMKKFPRSLIDGL